MPDSAPVGQAGGPVGVSASQPTLRATVAASLLEGVDDDHVGRSQPAPTLGPDDASGLALTVPLNLTVPTARGTGRPSGTAGAAESREMPDAAGGADDDAQMDEVFRGAPYRHLAALFQSAGVATQSLSAWPPASDRPTGARGAHSDAMDEDEDGREEDGEEDAEDGEEDAPLDLSSAAFQRLRARVQSAAHALEAVDDDDDDDDDDDADGDDAM